MQQVEYYNKLKIQFHQLSSAINDFKMQ